MKYQNSAETEDELMGALATNGLKEIQLDDPNHILSPVRLDIDSLDAMLLE